MLKKRRFRLFALLALGSITPVLRAAPPAGSERDLNHPVISGSQESFYPYSYRDDDGSLKGFAVDLIQAIGRAMKLDVHTQGVANADLIDALMHNRIDLIPLWSETPERRATTDFSVPILSFETVIVVRKGGPVSKPEDLDGKHVAVGQKGTLAEIYMLEQHPSAVREYARTGGAQLQELAAGKYDAKVMTRLTAVALIRRHKLHNLTIIDGIRGYDVRYCAAVRKGDTLLLSRINEGLAVVHETGEYDDIYQKWFGRTQRAPFTYGEIISIVAIALALICTVSLWGLISQRKLSRRIARQASELAEQRALLAALYDKHPLATLVVKIPVQKEPVLVSLNQEACSLYGLANSDNDARPFSELNLTNEMRAHLDNAVARQRVSDKPEQWEIQLPDTKRLLEVTTVPLDSRIEDRRICILSSDITKRRLTEQELSKSRRLRALGELVGGIAHEFNNLLTPIIATTSLLRSEPQSKTMPGDDLDIIEQSAHRAADLTRRLLTFGRKSNDPVHAVSMCEAVANCETLLKTMVDRRIEWSNDLPEGLPPVAFNPTDFNQIVFNLVLNARDSLLEKMAKNQDPAWKPRLGLSIAPIPGDRPRPSRSSASPGTPEIKSWQRLTVEDNGMGIPPEIVDRIFEPFYTTKEVGKGTGLGLATVWHQVTDAGGDVEVDSKPGAGARFHIYLPVCKAPPPTLVAPPPAKGSGAQQSALNVLVVEDEPLIAQTTARMLERYGCSVSTQADGLKAWQELSTEASAYDLLLVDLSMPHMNGIDLVKNLRTVPFKGRIVIMSGRVSDKDLRILKELKIDRFLPKPFTMDQFHHTISDFLTSGPK